MQRIRGASKHLQQSIDAISTAEIKVGFFAHSQHETDKGTVPTASIAATQELGSIKQGIPPRPFLNPALEEKRDDNVRLMLAAAKEALNGGDLSASLEQIGGKLVGDVQTRITEITQPALKQSTIDARARRHSKGIASDKPLVDTGQMLRAVSYEVVE